ncbi:tRNA pseudouridine synthase pus10-related [Anaeramoeba flamelloides]|uniref:tRNA pseudouridine(55) synthase n=1 Tax=Anaeramoeba flamelloides TaxID=1746091 RepID=A0AAV8AEP2_9EUKA|nr:tRNA pseudouridine synthase pus10-related [Anaeramoeba flamelloides]
MGNQVHKTDEKLSALEINIKSIEPQKEKFKTLFDLGCCFLCCYRIVGIIPPFEALPIFKDFTETHYQQIFGETRNSKLTTTSNSCCLACLNLLKTENLEKSLLQLIKKKGYQNIDSFGLSITIPPSIILREHCLSLYVSLEPSNIIPIKKILKFTVFQKSKLESALKVPQVEFDQACLSLKIGWNYPNDSQEMSKIETLLPSSKLKRKRKSFKTRLRLQAKENKILNQKLFKQQLKEKDTEKEIEKENENKKENENEKEKEKGKEKEKEEEEKEKDKDKDKDKEEEKEKENMEIENEKKENEKEKEKEREKQIKLEDDFLGNIDPEKQLYGSSCIQNTLKGITKNELGQLCPIPPQPVKDETNIIIFPISKPIYIFGRYLKMSRNIPNAPWYIKGERKGNYSVEEFVSKQLTNLFSGTHSGFVSSGREDIDVRMLGTGRPFILEIIGPKIYKKLISLEEQKQIIDQILQNSEGLVTVKDLGIVDKSHRKKTIKGEGKSKGYRCVVWCKCNFNKQLFTQKLQQLTKNTNGTLLLKQKTPVRVLHRRNLTVRQRAIYEIKIVEQINDNFVVIDLITQGGTYVKEFICGDFGRTNPSFSQIVGCKSEIVQLDVISVN